MLAAGLVAVGEKQAYQPSPIRWCQMQSSSQAVGAFRTQRHRKLMNESVDQARPNPLATKPEFAAPEPRAHRAAGLRKR